ncbi:MAG: LysM peptidoglycan-binding domain-containing protein [Anaerolineae bacterium]|nr:LysM peptidoglycan-binding domain-containing protein [Anaerolineae bacterium]
MIHEKILTRRMAGIMIGVLLAGIVLSGSPAAAQGDPGSTVIALVNQFRAANGLPAFTVDGSLMAAAQSHANWVMETRQFGHSGPGGNTPQDRATAAGYNGIAFENYVYGMGMTPQQAVTWWENSAIHRATMLSSVGQHIGIGYVSDGTDNLYVLVVGRPGRTVNTSSGSGGNNNGGNSAGSGDTNENEEDAEPPGPVVVPIVLAEAREDGSIVHVVQQGQTAWAIAARYGVDLDEMLYINGLRRPVVLKPGDEVIVRLADGQAPPPTPTPPLTHIVQEGETVWEVAVRNGLTVDELLALNGLTRADVIKPGDELLLRAPDSVPTAAPPTAAPPTATPTPVPTDTPVLSEAAIAATQAAELFAAAQSPDAATESFGPIVTPPTNTPAPPPTKSGGPPTLPPAPGEGVESEVESTVESPPTLVPTDTVIPPSPTQTATVPASPTATPQQVAQAVEPTGAPVAAGSNPAARQDDSDPDVVMIGAAALGVVWLLVGAAGLWFWMGYRRGR